MSIRSVIAAAAVAMGIGQTAEAASIRYEDTVLEEAVIWDSESGDLLWDPWASGPLSVHDAPWHLPSLYPGAKKGDLFEVYAEIEKYDKYEGYLAPVCYIGSFDCAVTGGDRIVGPGLMVISDAFAVWANGTILTVTSSGRWDGDGFSFLGDGYWGHADAITSTFTIVELAPVPLPATAVLLPMGIGALAVMRGRRRSA